MSGPDGSDAPPMLSSITENPNRSLFSLFFKSRTSNKGKLPPMISTKMNADSFGLEMESELDLEERGFGWRQDH